MIKNIKKALIVAFFLAVFALVRPVNAGLLPIWTAKNKLEMLKQPQPIHTPTFVYDNDENMQKYPFVEPISYKKGDWEKGELESSLRLYSWFKKTRVGAYFLSWFGIKEQAHSVKKNNQDIKVVDVRNGSQNKESFVGVKASNIVSGSSTDSSFNYLKLIGSACHVVKAETQIADVSHNNNLGKQNVDASQLGEDLSGDGSSSGNSTNFSISVKDSSGIKLYTMKPNETCADLKKKIAEQLNIDKANFVDQHNILIYGIKIQDGAVLSKVISRDNKECLDLVKKGSSVPPVAAGMVVNANDPQLSSKARRKARKEIRRQEAKDILKRQLLEQEEKRKKLPKQITDMQKELEILTTLLLKKKNLSKARINYLESEYATNKRKLHDLQEQLAKFQNSESSSDHQSRLSETPSFEWRSPNQAFVAQRKRPNSSLQNVTLRDSHSKGSSVAEQKISQRADHEKDEHGKNKFAYAIDANDVALLNSLYCKNADWGNFPCCDNLRPLGYAIQQGKWDIAKCLLEGVRLFYATDDDVNEALKQSQDSKYMSFRMYLRDKIKSVSYRFKNYSELEAKIKEDSENRTKQAEDDLERELELYDARKNAEWLTKQSEEFKFLYKPIVVDELDVDLGATLNLDPEQERQLNELADRSAQDNQLSENASSITNPSANGEKGKEKVDEEVEGEGTSNNVVTTTPDHSSSAGGIKGKYSFVKNDMGEEQMIFTPDDLIGDVTKQGLFEQFSRFDMNQFLTKLYADLKTYDKKARLNVDAPDKDGRTLLMLVVQNNKKGAIAALIDHGADVNHISNDGKSILYYACKQAAETNDCSVVEYLVETTGVTFDNLDTCADFLIGKTEATKDIIQAIKNGLEKRQPASPWDSERQPNPENLINKFARLLKNATGNGVKK